MTIVARLTLRYRCMVEHNNNQRDSHHANHDVVQLYAGSIDRVCDAHLIELCVYQEDRWSSCWVERNTRSSWISRWHFYTTHYTTEIQLSKVMFSVPRSN
jgi:hypothetical protein